MNPLVNSNWSYSPETLNLGHNWWFSVLRDLEIWWMTLKNNMAPLLCRSKLCKSFQSHRWIQMEWQSGNAQFGSKSAIFVPCDLEIWWMTLKNDRAPLLCYSKISSFHSRLLMQTGVKVWKIPIWVKINNLFSPVTLKFDRWPWKSIGHLLYATSNLMHHFLAICELKLEIQSGNA